MEKLPQNVLRHLQRTPLGTETHPDADLLTAFAEHGLSQHQHSLVIDHLAACKDCRDILALAVTVQATAQSEFLPSPLTRRPWFAWPVLRWAALAAGVLIVASVGLVQHGHHRQINQVALNSLPKEAPVSAPSEPSPRENPLPNGDSSALNTRAAASKPARQHTAKSSRVGTQKDSGPRPTVPAAAAADTQAQLAQNQPASLFPGRTDNQDVVKAKNPVPTQSGLSPTPPVTSPRQSLAPVSPGNFRWAITAGALQRSEDGGRTWQNVNPSPGSAREFLAIAVNGSEVWVGGSASGLYHTTDAGTHWTVVTPTATGLSLTGDIIGIQFSDPQRGKITTSTSELWLTFDDGQTWQKQQ